MEIYCFHPVTLDSLFPLLKTSSELYISLSFCSHYLLYRSLATDSILSSSWTSGSDDSWAYLKRDSRVLAERISTVSQKARDQVMCAVSLCMYMTR